MKCHNCNIKMSRSELRKHKCKHPYRSVGMSDQKRAYLKTFGSRPRK